MSNNYRYRLGIDIGGTFTDFTLVDTVEKSSMGIKTPTVPAHPEQGIKNGLSILKNEYSLDLHQVQYFVHGMTIGLNTLLQRRGSQIALFVTKGFRDVLTMQRMRLPVPYDFHSRQPEPLIPRSLVYGITERYGANGEEITPVDMASVDAAVEEAVKKGVVGIAICFLHSYQCADHEKQVAARIRETHPELKVCCSSELWPQIREYERACIAVSNLYIQKNVEEYFSNLQAILDEEGLQTRPFITQSNGGIMNLEAAAAAPIKTLFSGPAAGVIGAIHESEISGKRNLLTFDMGGTSTDISVILDGKPTYSASCELAGFPVALPTVDIESVGAGGGSIAWIDKGGILKVGPHSAGSDPGPACYGKSELPTLTDAFLLCGYVSPKRFAAGRMSLDPERSKKAIGKLAEELGKDVYAVADEMVQIAVASMYADLSNVMEQKGFDPRELSLVAYGGGGPVMANIMAAEMHAKDVFVPHRPGTLCAMGSLSADFTYDATSVENILLSTTPLSQLNACLAGLKEEAESWLDAQGAEVLESSERTITYFADAHYAGQSYEIEIELDQACLETADCSAIAEKFHDEHFRLYGHREDGAAVEVVTLRARIVASTPGIPELAAGSMSEDGGEASPIETRTFYYSGKKYTANIYTRESIAAGHYVDGPAVLEQDDTTTVVLPNWRAYCDEHMNIIISLID